MRVVKHLVEIVRKGNIGVKMQNPILVCFELSQSTINHPAFAETSVSLMIDRRYALD